MPDKKWVRIYDTHDKHTEISIARLKGKVRNAQSVEELFQIVLNNTHRFSDENGKPLAIVEELKKEVEKSEAEKLKEKLENISLRIEALFQSRRSKNNKRMGYTG